MREHPNDILNEHMHLNMIDVYQEKTGIAFRTCPNCLDIILNQHQKEVSPMETHSSTNPSKRFFFRKKSYAPAGLFQITVFRRCDLRTQTWSDSASEDYASSSFPLQRASQSELSKLLFIPEQ